MVVRATAAVLLLAAAVAFGCDDGDDDDSTSGWTDETCLENCEAQYAEELAASKISAVTAQVLDNGECQCAFEPCETNACAEWCLANEGIDGGYCDFLNCVCDEDY